MQDKHLSHCIAPTCLIFIENHCCLHLAPKVFLPLSVFLLLSSSAAQACVSFFFFSILVATGVTPDGARSRLPDRPFDLNKISCSLHATSPAHPKLACGPSPWCWVDQDCLDTYTPSHEPGPIAASWVSLAWFVNIGLGVPF